MQPEQKPRSTILATGLAMFSMFFGAGNVIFPLALGGIAQDKTPFAITGLIVTAVGLPFLGLIAMTLFNGNYKHFFERIGKVPGFMLALFIMAIIGPLGAMPRLITVSHATMNVYWPDVISLPVFSILSCILIYLLTFKKTKIVDYLGYILTPFLLLTVLLIIVMGFLNKSPIGESDLGRWAAFTQGLSSGYMTMDMLASFFFSSIILACLEAPKENEPGKKNYRQIIFMALKASLIGAGLLGIVYVGFCFTAAFNTEHVAGISSDQVLGKLALGILGPYAGIVAIATMALACLTTAIALAAVFGDFLAKDIFQGRIGYLPCLIGTLIVTGFTAMLSFKGITSYLLPILLVLYPAMITLSVMNLLHKLWHVKIVKTPVAASFLAALYYYFG